MKREAIWLGILVLCGIGLGFHGAIQGRVLSEPGQALAGVNVWLEGLPVGTATDSAGSYFLEVPMHGEFRVVFGFVGFRPETLVVMVNHGERVRRDVRLRPEPVPVAGVETRARRETVHESPTPEPTVVVPRAAAEQAGKATIGEAATIEAGIQLQKRCSACEASELSIQGLPGRFSLVLLEGLPVFSNLASRYILDILPVEFIDRLEVTKGASGSIWGSDAMAGAVNIRLLQPVRPLEAKGAWTRRSYGNDISAYLGSELSSFGLSVIGAHGNREPVDLNRDGISENTAFGRDIVLANVDYRPGSVWRLNAGGSFGSEARRAGAISGEAGADRVNTRRWDIWQRTGFTSGASELQLKLAGSVHAESGFVEQRDYSARQSTLFGELSATLPRITAGSSVSSQRLVDKRLFGDGYQETDVGFWAGGRNLGFQLAGVGFDVMPALRFDLNSGFGPIFSPYFALQVFPGWVDLSFAAGTGFRTPLVIFESMENLPNGYQYAIRRDTNLTRESALSLQAGAARRFVAGRFAADLRATLFHHRVADFIAAELVGLDSVSRRALFLYRNLDDVALSSGGELGANLVFPGDVSARVSAYLLAPRTAVNRILPFIRRWAAGYSVTWRPRRTGFELSVTGDVNGPMLVETVDENGGIERRDSPLYPVVNVRATKELKFLRLGAGVNNVGDFHQPPLSHHGGRSEYYWGPIIGREFYFTLGFDI